MAQVEVTFRLAEASDIDLLLEFIQELYATDGNIPFDRNGACAALKLPLDDPSLGRVWLILSGEEPIGYVVLTLGFSLEYHGRDAFIDEVFIVESHRGRGAGTAAIQFAEAQCGALGVNALHLEVERTNVRAQQLYRRMEFVDHDRYLMTKHLARRTND